MINLDNYKAKRDELLKGVTDAITVNDPEQIKNSLAELNDFMVKDFKAIADDISASTDSTILASRGVRQLTANETKFYENFIQKAKAAAAEGVITGIMEDLPLTIIESVLDDIKTEHPLLNVISFRATSAAIKWVLNAQGPGQTATWGDLNTAITEKLEGAIEIIDMTLCKLSAHMYATQDMLDLGPRWVDAYTRATLTEALSCGLERGIVDGSGLREPVGMTRDFTADFSQSTGFPRKEAIVVNDFGVETYGNLLGRLAKTRLGNPRTVTGIILVVNPVDYFTRVMVATTALRPDMTFANNIFPYATTVVQSVAVPEGHAVFGIAKNYFMGIGTAAPKSGKIETSDDYKFLEDLKTYKIKMHGNGRPVDMNSFLYLDITNVKAATPVIATEENKTAALTSLAVGDLKLSPAFSRVNTEYTATTTASSAAITVAAEDTASTVVIKNGETTVENGGNATFTKGNNKITISVTNGGKSRTYTVIVKKS